MQIYNYLILLNYLKLPLLSIQIVYILLDIMNCFVNINKVNRLSQEYKYRSIKEFIHAAMVKNCIKNRKQCIMYLITPKNNILRINSMNIVLFNF